ncbi:acetoacetate--CoA ligase [Panacagrimonas sp.]|uniref:acetoacetate--CoA ligase n=1 Tax=Panacagrimonas sp. TaxID=2480088 RepID=UPI003B5179CA
MSVAEGALLWTPSAEFAGRSQIARYLRWLRAERGLDFADYEALRAWSVDQPEAFWDSLWAYFEIMAEGRYERVLEGSTMQDARWFTGARVNYAEHLLRHEAQAAPDETAIHHLTENRPLSRMSWQELGRQVRIVAMRLRALGIRPGDRIVSYMPNVPETTVAMLASMAIGAVWSSAAPEFGTRTVVERFAQIEPKLIFACDGYRFGGKDFERTKEVRQIVAGLPTLKHVVWLDYLKADGATPPIDGAIRWQDLSSGPEVSRTGFRYERVGSAHPLWVMFSSGTTGLPKAITHNHVGQLIEHLKLTTFHFNLAPGGVMFFHSTTGWTMYNLLVSALLSGAAIVQYDGSPVHPGLDFLWSLAAATRATNFGASPTFVQMMEKAGLKPGEKFDLSALEAVLVAGAPSTPETFKWFYDNVKPDLWVTSQSGGTEVGSAFVGASPTLPVHAGEIQARCLGMDVRSWSDEGRDLVDEVGELVCVKPFPSMPIHFWNDEGGKRYHEAYFDVFPGVWRHGDFIKINARGGCYIYGRSDSTLNRFGVRIGTAEIYRTVEQVEEVADSLVVCCELDGGNFFMPLFLKLKPGFALDDALEKRIAQKLKSDCSPRHVPDRMYAVEQIPYTLTGKKMEVPVRKILMGWTLQKAASRDAMANPASIDWYLSFAATTEDYQRPGRPSGAKR